MEVSLMTDNEKEVTTPSENTEGSEQKVEGQESNFDQKEHNDQQAKLRLNEKLTKQAEKIAELESKLTSGDTKDVPNSDERIAALELKLARKEAQTDHNLSKEDMVLLTGTTPEAIEAQAEYLATRLGSTSTNEKQGASDQTGDSTGKTDDTTDNTSEGDAGKTETSQGLGDNNPFKPGLKTYEGQEDIDESLKSISNAFKKQQQGI